MTTGQSPSAMSWPAEGAYGTGADPRRGAPDVRQETYEHMNAAQASWSVMSTRRTAPAWIQRLGAFFQEMRAQQAPQAHVGTVTTCFPSSSRWEESDSLAGVGAGGLAKRGSWRASFAEQRAEGAAAANGAPSTIAVWPTRSGSP